MSTEAIPTESVVVPNQTVCACCGCDSQDRYYILKNVDVINYYNDPCSYVKGASFDLVTEFFLKDFDVPENIGAFVCSGCHKKLRKVKVWRVKLQNLINEIKELSQCFIDYKTFHELDLPHKKFMFEDRSTKSKTTKPYNALTMSINIDSSSSEKKPRIPSDVDRTASDCKVSMVQPQLPLVKLEPIEQNLNNIASTSVSSQQDTVNKRPSITTNYSLQDKTINIIRPPNTMASEQNTVRIRPANLVSILNKQVNFSVKPDHQKNIQFVSPKQPAPNPNNKSIISVNNASKPKQNNNSITTVKIKPASNQQNIAVMPVSIKPMSNQQNINTVKPVYTIKPMSNQQNIITVKPVNIIPVSDQQNNNSVQPVNIKSVTDQQNITTVMQDDLQSESNVQNNNKITPSIINHGLSQQTNTSVMLSGVKPVSSQQVISSIIKQASMVNQQDNVSIMPPNVITSQQGRSSIIKQASILNQQDNVSIMPPNVITREQTLIMPDTNVIVIQQTSTMPDISMPIQNLSNKPDTTHSKHTPGTHTVNKSSPIINCFNKSSETSPLNQQTCIAQSFHSPSQTFSSPKQNNSLLLCNSLRPTRFKLVKFKSIKMLKDLMPIVKCLADGNISKTLQLLLKSDVDYIFEASTKGLSTLIKTEAKEYARNKARLIEINKTPIFDFESFDIKVMQKEFETWTPTLWKCVCSAATSNFTKRFQSPKVCSALSILFHSRSLKLNMLQEYVAVAMYSCNLKKEGFRILSKLGFSVSCIQIDKRPVLNTAKIRRLVYMRKKRKRFGSDEDTEKEEDDIVLTDHEDIIEWDEADEMFSSNTDININKISEFTSEESQQMIVDEEDLCWGEKSKESLSYSVSRNMLNVTPYAERERPQQE
ncbi:uncharacterized protein LOC126823889 [Patella vulgata]|uniref:uncharacterized protein LOC126823889 n=1 Tax=Patella vulgata TaxID=6465 RepID=UPI0024A93B85|nr:uncharacterized protein LOC126823889 [Patella vulgata]